MSRTSGLLLVIAVLLSGAGPASSGTDFHEKITVVLDESAAASMTPSSARDYLNYLFNAFESLEPGLDITLAASIGGDIIPIDELWMPPEAVMEEIGIQGEANYYLWSLSPPPPRHLPSAGSLYGKRIFISPGHGLTWTGSGWYTQRGEYNGIIEDYSNAEICFHFLIPMLERMGATVFDCRERGRTFQQVVVDNDNPGSDGRYEETGEGWSEGTDEGYGGTYRVCPTSSGGGSEAHFYFTMPGSDVFPVYARWIAGSNRASQTLVRIVRPGGESELIVNQTAEDRRWYYIGSWYFKGGEESAIVVSNQGEEGAFVVADAVRIGGGMGEVFPSGARPTGEPKWKEAAKYWIEYVGAPSGVYNYWYPDEGDSDVVSRPLYADWEGGDGYFSHHTNGYDGTARGTVSFIHDSSPSPGSAEWQETIHSSVIHAITTLYDPTWYDRGPRTGNYGELRLVDTMPAMLLETAFHDNPEDAEYILNPHFRFDVSRAIAFGMGQYFSPELPAPPLPPSKVRAVSDGPGSVMITWEETADPVASAQADRYRIYTSRDGRGFDNGDLTTEDTFVRITGFDWPANYYFLVTAENDGGESMPSEMIGLRTSWTGDEKVLLLVGGFDRLDRNVREHENSFDFVVQHGEAIAPAGDGLYTFDYASNEAVESGDVALDPYMAVIWWTGEESTEDESFSDTEMALVETYLSGGGRMFVSGSEIGWDLYERGDAATRSWLQDVLKVGYVSDDAETYSVEASAGGIFDALSAFSFDDGSGTTYDADYPDVIEGAGGSVVDLVYATSGGASIEYDGGEERIVFWGFPFETVVDGGMRAELMERILAFLVPEPPVPPEEGLEEVSEDLAEDFPDDVAEEIEDGGDDAADGDGADGHGGGCSCSMF